MKSSVGSKEVSFHILTFVELWRQVHSRIVSRLALLFQLPDAMNIADYKMG